MPQLDISTYFSQLFWFFLIFTLLFIFIKFVFTRKMDSMFAKRDKVKEGMDLKIESLKKTLLRLQKEHLDALDGIAIVTNDILNDATMEVEDYRIKLKKQYKDQVVKLKSHHLDEFQIFKKNFVEENLRSFTNLYLLYLNIIMSDKHDNYNSYMMDIDKITADIKYQIFILINEVDLKHVI